MTELKPHVGLVVNYDYLWHKDKETGAEIADNKERPCCVVSAAKQEADSFVVLVMPITHSPQDKAQALKIPPQIEQILHLDGWVVCSEVNKFIWPPSEGKIKQYGTITSGFLKAIQTKAQTVRNGNNFSVVSRSS